MTPSILLVDDDRFFRDVAADLLVKRGHKVVGVASGDEALAEMRRQPHAVVITDVVMPGMDGLTLATRLRELNVDQEIILVSQRDDMRTATTALRAGLSDYLHKPVNEAELLLAVERALERATLRRERERLMRENVDFAQYQSIHERCLEFLSNADLEWLQERILGEMIGLCDAQSAALWIADDRNELVLRAYRGLLDKHSLPEKLAMDGLEAARMRERAPWISGEGRAQVLHVPLVAGGDLMGFARLSDPLGALFKGEHLRGTRILADFAAVGLKNGRRIQALQRLGLRDRDTAAYNLSYFTDYASKEIYKARRYGRTFSLLTFSIDNISQVRLRLGALEARRAVRGVIKALSRIIRDSDVIAKASEQEFYLLLPETDFFGAVMFGRRAAAAMREEPEVREVEARFPLGVVSGAGTYPKDGDDFDELVQKCRRRMDERRVSLQRKLVLDSLSFWEEVELLLGSASSPKLPSDDRAEPSRRGRVADLLFDELQTEIARELQRDPSARGLLYVGGPEVRADLPVAAGLEGAPPDLSSRVYLLGRRKDLDSHPALTPVFLEGDERLNRHQFVLWLNEHSAYALLQRRGKGATWGFHTSDTAVVDGLISKLQAEYDLQPY